MTDNPDLDEAIRLLGKRVCAPELWTARDTEATGRLLAKYPERPKLLPCPFCGGEAATINLGSTWIAACRRPGPSRELSWCARTATWADEDDAIAAWNRRAKPASGPVDGGKPE